MTEIEEISAARISLLGRLTTEYPLEALALVMASFQSCDSEHRMVERWAG